MFRKLIFKYTNRDGGSIALFTAYTVYTVYSTVALFSLFVLFTLFTLFTLIILLKLFELLYTAYTVGVVPCMPIYIVREGWNAIKMGCWASEQNVGRTDGVKWIPP